VGSVCSSERETHPFQTPISLLLAIPVFLGFAILQEPNHVIWHVASFFPFITPSLMLFRFVIRQPPLWEIVATWLTLVVATVGMMWAATRVFRVGILIYGKRPTIPEILRWVRTS
jgi:ABC-2 type transport system permease protein